MPVGALTLGLALGLVASSCTGDDDPATPTSTAVPTSTTVVERADDGVLTVGVYLPRTGDGAPLGEPMIAALQTQRDVVNAAGGVLASDVEVVVVDEGAATGLEELLDDNVDAIIGPASSLNALSQLAPAVDPQTGVVTCSPTATALSLDRYPDAGGFFYRTAPSDSLQMVAIAREAQRTGATTVAIGYLDDPYGRGLVEALTREISQRRQFEVLASVGFSGDEEDLSAAAAEILADDPGVVVVLGDAGDGGRLLTALDAATAADEIPPIIVNDAIRGARQTLQGLSTEFRRQVAGVAPLAATVRPDGPEGFFTAHAIDCFNLIALATIAAGSDAPARIRTNMAGVSTGGRICQTFEQCATLLQQGLRIDYDGYSGDLELATATGDPTRAWFETFRFDGNGADIDPQRFEVP